MNRTLRICDIGLIGYRRALEIQEKLFLSRIEGRVPDTLLLLEHEHVLTLGRNATDENLLEPVESLRRQGLEVERTGRGGDVTYHGPGQLVGYPVISLREAGVGVSDYVAVIEDVIIEVLESFGLSAGRDDRNRGVWIGNAKIAAIGLRVRKHVSIHGFALNVSPDLGMYSKIIACGVQGAGVTSMKNEGCVPEMGELKTRIASAFSKHLGYDRTENVEQETIT